MSEDMNKLLKILSMDADDLASSFSRASIEGRGTPQEVSDGREGAFKSLLEKYFPFPYKIVKGNIIDYYGAVSCSIDCIVLNPCHPYTINKNNDKASVIFADGVDFAFEIKGALSDKKEIERALNQVQSVKKLRRVKDGLLLKQKYTNEQLECAKTIPCVLIVDNTYSDLKRLIEYAYSYYKDNNIPPIEQFDLILVNRRCLIYNFRNGTYVSNDHSEGMAVYESEKNSLAAMLYEINAMPQCQPFLNESVLKIYLSKIRPGKLKTYPDLDLKYLNDK